MTAATVHRLAAFADAPQGGNPAGIVVTDAPLDPDTMQRIATDVGYSETAFCTPTAQRAWSVRYFAPAAEVPFCGHATIAAGVHLAGRVGTGRLDLWTPIGPVPVDVDTDADGEMVATLTSRPPTVTAAAGALIAAARSAFGWTDAVHPFAHEPVVADAGARHLLLPMAAADALEDFDHDFSAMEQLMAGADLTTVALAWSAAPDQWHVRNAFAAGGVVEDPATGAAAAAMGGWLRTAGLVDPPAGIEVMQGAQMGRPSRILVHIPVDGGTRVSGRAVPIT